MGATEVLKSRNIIICSPDWCYSHLNTNAQIAWLIVNKSYSYRESSEAMNVGSYTLGGMGTSAQAGTSGYHVFCITTHIRVATYSWTGKAGSSPGGTKNDIKKLQCSWYPSHWTVYDSYQTERRHTIVSLCAALDAHCSSSGTGRIGSIRLIRRESNCIAKQSGSGTRVGVPQVRVLWQICWFKMVSRWAVVVPGGWWSIWTWEVLSPENISTKMPARSIPACRVCLSVGFLCWRPSRYGFLNKPRVCLEYRIGS